MAGAARLGVEATVTAPLVGRGDQRVHTGLRGEGEGRERDFLKGSSQGLCTPSFGKSIVNPELSSYNPNAKINAR